MESLITTSDSCLLECKLSESLALGMPGKAGVKVQAIAAIPGQPGNQQLGHMLVHTIQGDSDVTDLVFISNMEINAGQ